MENANGHFIRAARHDQTHPLSHGEHRFASYDRYWSILKVSHQRQLLGWRCRVYRAARPLSAAGGHGWRAAFVIGAARGTDKPLDAHAWLDAAGVEVTGYPVAEGFAEIACFV